MRYGSCERGDETDSPKEQEFRGSRVIARLAPSSDILRTPRGVFKWEHSLLLKSSATFRRGKGAKPTLIQQWIK